MSTKTITVRSLLNLNRAGMWLHLIQGVAMIALVSVLGTSKSFDVTVNFLTYSETLRQLVPASRELFSVNFAWLVSSFLFMSAFAHFWILRVYRKTYLANLKLGINKARWYEYSISASTMMVAIALLSGMSDAASLIMLFTMVAVMNLMGLVMEVVNQGKQRPDWLSYIVGCIAGIMPWIAFGIYVWAANNYSTNGVPGFVYGIYASIFVFFNCFAINMWLQYKKVGKWANYLYGEKVYIVLSLVAKSALAWQVFGGVFQP